MVLRCDQVSLKPLKNWRLILNYLQQWDEMYDVVRFPLDSPDGAQRHLPYDSIQRVDEQNLYLNQKYKNKKKSTLKSSAGIIKSPQRDQVSILSLQLLKLEAKQRFVTLLHLKKA